MLEHSHLSNGQLVDLRLATPEDFDAVRDFYRALDDDSTFSRVFGIGRQLPEGWFWRDGIGPDLVDRADSQVHLISIGVGPGHMRRRGEPNVPRQRRRPGGGRAATATVVVR